MRVVLLAASLLGAAWGENISVGVQGGVRASGDLSSYFAHSESRRYVVGPTIEWAVHPRWSLVLETLYRRNGWASADGDVSTGGYLNRARAHSWEFPMLLKARLRRGIFLDGGYAVRTMQWTASMEGLTFDIGGGMRRYTAVYTDPRQVSHGAVAGAGIAFAAGPLHIAPEFRYTRWNNLPVDIQGTRGYSVQSTRNQMDILVGVRWP